MERKGFVRHARTGTILVFAATVDRDELIRRRLQGLADALCGGAVAPLVMNLVKEQPLEVEEMEQLYSFLRERRKHAKNSRVSTAE
jgi:predicted transcriptional regulator